MVPFHHTTHPCLSVSSGTSGYRWLDKVLLPRSWREDEACWNRIPGLSCPGPGPPSSCLSRHPPAHTLWCSLKQDYMLSQNILPWDMLFPLPEILISTHPFYYLINVCSSFKTQFRCHILNEANNLPSSKCPGTLRLPLLQHCSHHLAMVGKHVTASVRWTGDSSRGHLLISESERNLACCSSHSRTPRLKNADI